MAHANQPSAGELLESPDDSVEVLDGVYGEDGASLPVRVSRSSSPARVVESPARVAAVAAGGFLAGAAAITVVNRRRARRAMLPARRRPARLTARRRRAEKAGPLGELVQIVGTRSLLVDVHLLGGRD